MTPLSQGPKRSPVNWNQEAEDSFIAGKEALLSIQTLSYPRENLPLTLTTDASDKAIGAVLHQIENSTPRPLEFFSQKLASAQTRYSAFDRELLGIFLSIKHFQHLLDGRKFTILTDHKPLLYIHTMKNPSPRQQRQINYISQFSCDIKNISGHQNIIADGFSRISCGILLKALFSQEVLREHAAELCDLEKFDNRTLVNDIHCDKSLP